MACPVIGLTVNVTSVVFCYDPLFLVLKDAVSDFNIGFVCICIRMYFSFSAFEISHTAANLLDIYIFAFDGLIKQIEHSHTIVSTGAPDINYLHKSSIRLTLPYHKLAATADITLSSLYSGAVLALAMAGWLVVNGYDLVPKYLYWLIFLMVSLVFLILFGMLLIVGSVCYTRVWLAWQSSIYQFHNPCVVALL